MALKIKTQWQWRHFIVWETQILVMTFRTIYLPASNELVISISALNKVIFKLPWGISSTWATLSWKEQNQIVCSTASVMFVCQRRACSITEILNTLYWHWIWIQNLVQIWPLERKMCNSFCRDLLYSIESLIDVGGDPKLSLNLFIFHASSSDEASPSCLCDFVIHRPKTAMTSCRVKWCKTNRLSKTLNY